MESAAAVLRRLPGEVFISKQKLRQAEAVECVRLKRDSASQSLGFASRPFVLCGLPIKRPANGILLHGRRNGQFLLQITGHPTYGLPWGQDRLRRSPRMTHFCSVRVTHAKNTIWRNWKERDQRYHPRRRRAGWVSIIRADGG